jgi:Coenzyme F420-dependent N5,N10-methylene tetrahydromethanopterin reductase and related flavin-dependent oxidoreductases
MDVGIHFMNFNLSGGPERLRIHARDTAQAAEAAGCTMFTCMDHYFQMEAFTRAEDPMLEGYTRSATSRAHREDEARPARDRRQLSLSGTAAKIVTTLDVLSGGRGMLGIGAAWYEREHVGLGVPFYPIAERLERLEETCRSASRCGATTTARTRASTTSWRDAERSAALSKPHPPILIGGGGERKLLRLVAKYADMNNLFSSSPEEVRHKLDVLARHCEEVGRDRAEIRNTTIGRISPDTDLEVRRDDEGVRDLGMEHVQLALLTDEPARLVESTIAKLVPQLAEL